MKKFCLKVALSLVLYIFITQTLTAQNILTYAGNSGKERFMDVVELSNGKLLIAGQADNLNWLPPGTPITTLTINLAPGVSALNSVDSRVAFLMLLSGPNMGTIEHVVRFPAGTVADVSRIRTTNEPGQPTGTMYISGKRTFTTDLTQDGYYIAKLNNNFVNGIPTACSWLYPVSARPRGANTSAYKIIQPWDVGNDGSVVYGLGTDYDWSWAAIEKLDANGNKAVVENWPYHQGTNGEQTYKPASAYTGGIPTYSSVVLKAERAGSLRSSVNGTSYWNGYNFNGLDENNKPRKGKFPDDWFFGAAEGDVPPDGRNYGRLTDGLNYSTSPKAYRTNFGSTRPTARLGSIVIDRRDNHIYFGYSTQSAFKDGNKWVPDFEPVIVAMNQTGAIKWWARLYEQNRISEPDQYIDGLAIDYTNDYLVVLARQHGFNVNMFWRGNNLFFNAAANGFKNTNSGINTIQTGHYSWLGKYDLIRNPVGPLPVQPKIFHATYIAEYADNPTGLGAPSSDPKLDNWPAPNSGFPDLNTTRCQTYLSVAPNGNVVVIGNGRRTITTVDAHQKMPKPGTGSVSTWNQFIRVYRPDLSWPVYSTLLTGAWDTLSGVGGANTEIYAAIPFNNGVYVVGYHQADPTTGVARPNGIPTANVPTWGSATPNGESAIFGRLGFVNLNPISLNLTSNNFCSQAGSNTGSLSFSPPPAFLVNFNPGNQFQVEISAADGKFAEDGGTTTVIGSLNSTSNATQTINYTIPNGLPSSPNYGIRVRATNPVTPGFWYNAVVVNAAPATPAAITGPSTICSNNSGATEFTINKVANTAFYQWEIIPTVANPNDPCDVPTCAGKISGSDTIGVVAWNPSYSGSATVRVRAVNTCGVSAWQTFNVVNVSPCISNQADFDRCAGLDITVPFTIPAGVTVSAVNQFQIELSDISGNFPGTVIATVNNIAPGVGPLSRSATATLPLATPAGTNYRIRVNAISGTTPSVSSLPSSSLNTVRNIPAVPNQPSGTNEVCFSNLSAFYTYTTNNITNATGYEWQILPDSAGTIITGTDINATITWLPISGTKQVRVRSFNGCGSSAYSSPLNVSLTNCIQITSVNPSTTLCASQTGVSVSFSTPNGVPFVATNNFTAEILDAAGNVVASGLGQVSLSNVSPFNSIVGTTANFTIPLNIVPGQYFIRMRSSQPIGQGGRFGDKVAITITNGFLPQPGTISGNTNPTCGQSGVAYSIAPVIGATSYTWRLLPPGAGTISGSGTSISINFTNNYIQPTARLQVEANGTCQTSVPSELTINLGCSAPAAPAVPVPNTAGNWRSRRSGSWFTPGTWETFSGGNWIVSATTFPTSSAGIIQIQNGHTVNVHWPLDITPTNSPALPSLSTNLNGVTLSSNNSLNAAVVGSGGTAWRTTNGGTDWISITTGVVQDLNSVSTFTGGQRVLAVGNNGTILRGDGGAPNTLGGNSWNAPFTLNANGNTSPITDTLNFVDINAGSGLIVGNNGRVIIVTGTDGSILDDRTSVVNTTNNLRGCHFYANGSNRQAHIVGDNGFYINTNQVAWTSNPTWNAPQTLPGSPRLNAVAFQNTGVTNAIGIIVGNGGVIFRTTNSGTSWTAITSPTTENLRSVRWSVQDQVAFIVGDNGTILISIDIGANWFLVATGTGQRLKNVSASPANDRQHGFAVGNNGVFYTGFNHAAANLNIDQVVIEENATLNVGLSSVTMVNGAGMELDIAGTLDLKESGTNFEWSNTAGMEFILRSTGRYRHGRNGGSLQRDLFGRFQTNAPQPYFMPGAVVEVYGVTTNMPDMKAIQAIPNFVWNCAQQTATLTITNPPLSTTQSFRVQSTGTGILQIHNAPGTFTYNYPTFQMDNGTLYLNNNNTPSNRAFFNTSNFVMNGGTFNPMGTNQGLATFNVGNFSQTGGTIDFNPSGNTTKGAIFNVSGNFIQTGGFFRQNNASTALPVSAAPVFLNGSANQNLRIEGTFGPANLDLQLLNSGSGYTLTGNVNTGALGTKWASGNINLASFDFNTGTLTATGAPNTIIGTITGTSGFLRPAALAMVTGKIDNSADRLELTNPTLIPVSGVGLNTYIIGHLRKVFGPGASGNYTFPVGSTSDYRPIQFRGFTNDNQTKTIGVTFQTSGANQASGVKIVNVGTQTGIGGLNWRIRRTAGSGNINNLNAIAATHNNFNADHRLGQSNIGLTVGFASVGGNAVENAELSTTALKYYDLVSTKAVDALGINTVGGSYFAIGGSTVVTPPPGGYSVGPSGDFPNLTSVAAEYNDVKFNAPVTFTFSNLYEGRTDSGGTEVFPIVFRQNQTQPVLIRYLGSDTIETSNASFSPLGEPLIVLDGADKITFQGNDRWRFLNKEYGPAANTFRLVNGATENVLKDLIIEGSDSLKNYSGVIFLGSSNTTQGNSNNTFESCRIASNGDRRLEPIVIGIANNSRPGLPHGAVIDASNTTPIQITTPMDHGFATGQQVRIQHVHGNWNANGIHTITVTGPRTFTLNGTSGNGDFRVLYFINNVTNLSGPVRLRTADVYGNTENHNVPINTTIRVEVRNLGGITLSGSTRFARAVSANEFDLYANEAGTVNITGSGTYTGGGTLRFETNTRLNASGRFRALGNGTIDLLISNITKLGNNLIEVTTSANHNLLSGYSVRMTDVTAVGGNMQDQINRPEGWLVDVTAPNRFTLRNSNGANGGVNVTGTYTGGGEFMISPMVVTANNHGLITGNPVTINGVSGVYTANNTHTVRRLDNNSFSLWEDEAATIPRYISMPGVDGLGGAPGVLTNNTGFTGTPVFSRPGIPMIPESAPQAILGVASVVPVGSGTEITFIVANNTFAGAAPDARFYVRLQNVTGFTITSPNLEYNGGTNGFGYVVAHNQFRVIVPGTSIYSPPPTQTGIFTTAITVTHIINTKQNCNSNVLNTWSLVGCNEEVIQPEINFSKNTGMRPNDVFTISGITGPTPNHPYNGTFRALTEGFQGNGGSTIFSTMAVPTTVPVVNGGGVPNLTANPDPPFNGEIVAAYDLLANKLFFSQNLGTTVNANNVLKDNVFNNFDSVAIAITPNGNGGGWQITGNSIFNRLSQPPKAGSGAAAFVGLSFIPGQKSSGNVISGNHIGGSQPLSAGNAMVFSRGITLSCFQIDVGNEGVTRVENNVIRNLNAVSFSGATGSVQAFDINGGRVDLKNNIFGGTDNGGPEDTIRIGGTSALSYFVRNRSTDSVAIVNNSVGHIRLPNATDYNYMVGLESNGRVLVKGNRFYKMSADFSFFNRQITIIKIGQGVRQSLGGTTNGTVTLNNHGLSVGDFVLIESSSNTPANNSWRVGSVLNANQFTLEGYTGSGSSSSGNGSLIRLSPLPALSANIDSNQVYHIVNTNGGSGMSNTTMIRIYATNAKGIIRKNRMYGNTNVRQANFLNIHAPTTTQPGWLVINNQATLVGASSVFSPVCFGINNNVPHNPAPQNVLPRFYFNTIWLRNNSGNANSNMYGYAKTSSGRAVVRNNIFFVAGPTNAGGRAIGASVQNTANWQGSDFSHNLFYYEGQNTFLAQWQSNLISSISGWQAFAGANSVDNLFNFANFEEVQPAANGNLALSSDNCPIKDKGINVGVYEDYDSLNVRSIATPDIGSNEFSKSLPTGAYWIGAVNNDWDNDANWCDQRVPLANEDVTITNVPAKKFMPVVSNSSAVCRNITIANNPGSMLIVYGPQAALTIGGDAPRLQFTHDNLSNINGRVFFLSDSVQNVPGSLAPLPYTRKNPSLPTLTISNVNFSFNPDLITFTTSTNHNLAIGDMVLISGVGGLSGANGLHKVIDRPSSTQFRIRATASGSYTAGTGRVQLTAILPISNVTNNPTQCVITVAQPLSGTRNHGLVAGQCVTIVGVRGNSEANGSWQVEASPLSATQFAIPAVSTNAFLYDSNAYVIPARTGYYDLVMDGDGTKTSDGVIEAASLTVNDGTLTITAGANNIRDSIRVNTNGQLDIMQGATTSRQVFVEGEINLMGGDLTITDSLSARNGSITLAGGNVTCKNLMIHGNAAVVNSSGGLITVSDTLSLRGGTINNTGSQKIQVGRRLNLRSGMININNPSAALEMSSVTNFEVLGGSATSFVNGRMIHNVNSLSGQQSAATSITSIAGGNPVTVNRNAHGLQTGDKILIAGVGAFPAVNGVWTVTVVNANSFTLNNSNLTGSSGASGTFTRFGRGITSGTSGNPIIVNVANHGFSTGDVVFVEGVSSHIRANGTWPIEVIDANNFRLVGSVGNGSSGAGEGTVIRLQTRRFPVGKGTTYRPIDLHLAQGFTTATAYSSELFTAAPPTLGFPGGLTGTPSYLGLVNDIVTSVANGRYFAINQTPSNAVIAAAVTLSYGTEEGFPANGRNKLTILKDSVPHTEWLNVWGYAYDTLAPIRRIVSNRNFTTFSNFVLGGLDNEDPLPLTLLSFKAVRSRNNVLSHWETTWEENLDKFVIERSLDGREFIQVGAVSAKNHRTGTTYHFVDANAALLGVQKLYYRLRSIDNDKKHNLSKVEEVSLDVSEAAYTVYPNPTKNTLYIRSSLEQASLNVELTDLSGKTVLTKELRGLDGRFFKLNMKELPTGIYVLKLINSSGVYHEKVVKQ
jgi:hypothetical protein